jgi:hypothetical protein
LKGQSRIHIGQKINLPHITEKVTIPITYPSFFVKKNTQKRIFLPHIVHKHLSCCIPPQGDKLSGLKIVEETRPENKSEPNGRNVVMGESRLLAWMERHTCKR